MKDRERAHLSERAEARAWADVAASAPEAFRAAVGLEARPLGGGTLSLMAKVDHAQFNHWCGWGLDAPPSEADLDAALAAYGEAGVRSFLILRSPLLPEATAGWMRARGLEPKRPWVKVLRELDALPASPCDLPIVETWDGPRFGRTVCAAFGSPPSLAPLVASLPGRRDWRCFLALDPERGDDEAVGCGALYLGEEVAWLGIGATLPSHRGRGVQGAVIAARLRAAASAGRRLATSEAAEDLPEKPNPSIHNLLRLGFEALYARENWGLP